MKFTYLLFSIYDNCDQTICLEPVITVKQKIHTSFEHIKTYLTPSLQTELLSRIYKPNILPKPVILTKLLKYLLMYPDSQYTVGKISWHSFYLKNTHILFVAYEPCLWMIKILRPEKSITQAGWLPRVKDLMHILQNNSSPHLYKSRFCIHSYVPKPKSCNKSSVKYKKPKSLQILIICMALHTFQAAHLPVTCQNMPDTHMKKGSKVWRALQNINLIPVVYKPVFYDCM